MAQKYILLSVLWIAVAIVGIVSESVPTASPTADETGSPNTAEPTPPPPAPCDSNPCGDGSTCSSYGPDSFMCSCLAGDTYDYQSQTCTTAKIFPGQLTVPRIPYTAALSDETSEEFRVEAERISDELDRVFKGTNGYIGSRVLKITQNSNSATREGTVAASVENIFEASSDVTSSNVRGVLEVASACSDCLLRGSKFTERTLCEDNPCDKKTASCKSSDGAFMCTCLDGFMETIYSDRMCTACAGGQKPQGSECVNCPFGYTGFNCEENWKLLLVIIGSVLGGLLLICLILLPVVALTCGKKSSKRKRDADIGQPYITHSSAKSPLANGQTSLNGSAAGVPRIPRAATNNPWDSRTNLEMISNSRQNLISEGRNSRRFDDADDITPYGLSRQNSQYAQRSQGNPYGQNRAQFNPYAQNQGHSNPYFVRDGGR